MVDVPEEFISFLQSYQRYVLVGHEDPDGDCLGSQLALGSFLRRMGKTVCLVSPGPFGRGEISDLIPHFATTLAACDFEPDAAVIVDCSTPSRTGSVSGELDGLPAGVIDHHASGEPFGEARFVDPTAPSVTYLILKLMEAMGHDPTPREAEWLLFGICTDTGYFRHLSEGSGDVFAVVAQLVDAGSSPKRIYHEMYGHQTLESRLLVGRLLTRTESLFEGRVLITWQNGDDLEEFGTPVCDSDTVYRELQRVGSCEVVVLIREEPDKRCTVGLRSLHDVDVGHLAKRLGGGGHRNAAGCTVEGTIDSVRSQLVEAIEAELVRV